MKTILMTVVFIAVSGLAIAEPGITITENSLANGDSEIIIDNPIAKVKKTYKLNLSDHHNPATSPDDPLVKEFKSWEFGAFICYNSNQYSGTEYCSSKDPVADFNPTNLDVQQWIRVMKDAGMNYAVLTVRHTSEFLLWDSATSECNVTNSAYGKDLVKEYVQACRKADIQPGIYYCMWGGANFRPYKNARAVILAQIYELATQYGEIPYFWFDMPRRLKWMPADLTEQEVYDLVKNINPNTVVIFNYGIGDGAKNKVFPSDIVNGEMCVPPEGGHNPWRDVNGRRYYLPYEYEPCSQQRGTHRNGAWDFVGASWFTYGEGKDFDSSKSLSAEFLYKRIRVAKERGASNILLSCAPDYTGQFRKDDVKQLVKLGQMLKDPSLEK